MGRIVTVTVIDLTRPVEQKGFKAVALFDFTTDVTPALITDTKSLTADTSLLKSATAFFANGGSSILIAGKNATSAGNVFEHL